MSTYDALVIGAGHNGLAAAIHLASKGWKVAVIEAQDEPGGAVKTREVTLPGFKHDLYAMSLGQIARSPFMSAYEKELKAYGLAFVSSPTSYASVFPDGTHIGVSTDVPSTLKSIAAVSPNDAEAWSAMLGDFQRKAPHIGAVLGAPIPSWGNLKTAWRTWRAGGMPLIRELAKLVVSSPREFLDARFESDKVKALAAAWGIHVDFTPDIAGGAVFPFMSSMGNQLRPMVLGAGGSGTLIKAMVSLLEAKGGELLLSSPVSEVLMEGNTAVGVKLADGRTLQASRAVISNLQPKLLFGSLVPPVPGREAFDRAIANYRAGPANMVVHFALDNLPAWGGSDALKSHGYIHIAPSMNAISHVYQDAMEGLLPAEPLMIVGQPTAIDPSRAPAGKHILGVQLRFLPAEIQGDEKGEITARDWDEAKEAYADRVVDVIDRYAPGFKASILGRYVVSPKDLERANANLIGGDSSAGSHHLSQNFFFRPALGYSRYKTPVKNLYMCGAATWPGAGVSAASGYMLARMLASRNLRAS